MSILGYIMNKSSCVGIAALATFQVLSCAVDANATSLVELRQYRADRHIHKAKVADSFPLSARIPALRTQVDYSVIAQPVGVVLETLTGMAGLSINGASNLTETVENWHGQGALDGVLKDLASKYNIYIYSDGIKLYAVSWRDVETRLVMIQKANGKDLIRLIHEVFPLLPRNTIVLVSQGQALRVTGPSRLSETVEKLSAQTGHRELEIVRAGIVAPH